MSDKPHDLNRYGVALSTGEWEYRNAGDDRWVQHWVAPDQPRETPVGRPDCRTPADYRACAEVVERWEADHAPKMRRRVVQDTNGRYWARHETLDGFVWDPTPTSARGAAKTQDRCDSILATDANLAMLADLAARPDEEVPRGE
jgi:hypothetical protein